MPFLFNAPARFSHSPTGEREPFDAVFIHCSGPLFSLSHWREGTVRCRFYSLLRPAFLPLPSGEREPFDAVFIHCSGPLFSLSHWREGTVRCRFYSLLRPAFLPLPSGEGRGEGSSHTAGNRPIKLRFCRGCDIISSSFSTQAK